MPAWNVAGDGDPFKLPWVIEHLPPPLQQQQQSVSSGGYRKLCKSIARSLNLVERGEWESYQQGAASFIDAWFYRDSPEFRSRFFVDSDNAFTGLCIQLNLFAPYAVMQEFEKTWDDKGGSAGLPGYQTCDTFPTPAVRALAEKATTILAREGILRLRREDLAAELPPNLHVESNLAGEPQRLYDALFYWYD